MTRIVALAAVLALGLCGCATTGGSNGQVEGVFSQPFRDLSLVREETPPVLAATAATPYAVRDSTDCGAIRKEIADLDAVLGPDLDAPAGPDTDGAQNLAIAALRSVIGLPFRGLIRSVTGAAKHDRERELAVLSGLARRGYLKGLARSACVQSQG